MGQHAAHAAGLLSHTSQPLRKVSLSRMTSETEPGATLWAQEDLVPEARCAQAPPRAMLGVGGQLMVWCRLCRTRLDRLPFEKCGASGSLLCYDPVRGQGCVCGVCSAPSLITATPYSITAKRSAATMVSPFVGCLSYCGSRSVARRVPDTPLPQASLSWLCAAAHPPSNAPSYQPCGASPELVLPHWAGGGPAVLWGLQPRH